MGGTEAYHVSLQRDKPCRYRLEKNKNTEKHRNRQIVCEC